MNDYGHGRRGFIFFKIEHTLKIKIAVFHSLFFGFPLIITATDTKVETRGQQICQGATKNIATVKILIDNLTVTQ